MTYDSAVQEIKDNKQFKNWANDLYLASDSVGMSEWEKDFCFDVSRQNTFTPKQKQKLSELVERYTLG